MFRAQGSQDEPESKGVICNFRDESVYQRANIEVLLP